MSYRLFDLINSKGEMWHFTDHDFHVFLNEPENLGFKRTFTLTRYGNSQVINDTEEEFPTPRGEIIFLDQLNEDRYIKFDNFARFVSHEPLQLVYIAPGIGSFTLDCVVNSLEKTESEVENYMSCPVEFQGLGFWKGEEIEKHLTDTQFTLLNDGDFPCGFEITIDGSMYNPDFTLSQDGVYGEAKFISDSTSFSSVYVNSNDGKQSVTLKRNGSIVNNSLALQDLSISSGDIYVTFIKLARGTSTLSISVSSGSVSNVYVKYQPIYRSI